MGTTLGGRVGSGVNWWPGKTICHHSLYIAICGALSQVRGRWLEERGL